MASNTRTKPGQEVPEEYKVQEGTEVLENIQAKYEKNKKRINTVIVAVVAVVAGYFGYQKLMVEPNNEKASAMMYFADKYRMADSADKALQGDGQHKGYLAVIKKYGGTDAGNMAKYYAGVCYLKKADYKNAIKYLEDFNGKGTLVEYSAFGAMGDAYMNMGNTDKAIDFYKKAGGKQGDALHAPIYLFRAGLAYEKANKPEEAKKLYKQIRDEYPQSPESQKVDKQLALLGELE
jgi:tetratricopeptide (TPR) repeat protein